MKRRFWSPAFLLFIVVTIAYSLKGEETGRTESSEEKQAKEKKLSRFDRQILKNSAEMMLQGRRTFRFDTFGSEEFWGDALQLHEAVATVTPKDALGLGLKVSLGELPAQLIRQLRQGQVDLDSPATTLALLKLNAVVGVTGFFNDQGGLRSIGIQCALCHSTVDNALAPGIGHRLDGWANHDLNIGAIAALAPNLQPVAELLGTDQTTVRKVLNSWGPGKFDAQLLLDGKGFRPDGKSAATLIPSAFGLAGVNNHTWTGSWGTVSYWNAFVANIEMHGKGTFIDPRLNDAAQFPVASKAGLGNIRNDPDLITSKLPALQFYQLAIPAPKPPADSFDEAAAERGNSLFKNKAKCATCHVPPLFTEPGWNLHTPEEIGIDDFQANRAPDKRYRTAPLNGIWTRQTGGFYHDGRFATLLDVVNHYDNFFQLGLAASEKNDLVEYLKSLPAEEK
jgi:hypothetical protein